MAWHVVACSTSSRTDSIAALAAAASGDRDIACASDAQASDAIAFTTVDLGEVGRQNANQSRILTGPQTRAVIRDSTQWPQAWARAVDSVPPPVVSFGNDAVVLVATRTYTVAPTSLEVVAVRRCRSSDVLIIAVRQSSRTRGGGEDVWSRGLQAIRVRRSEVLHGTIKFVDL